MFKQIGRKRAGSCRTDLVATIAVIVTALGVAIPGCEQRIRTPAARTAAAQQALDDRGIHMSDPIVITEAEYYSGYTMSSNDGVVFVLPNGSRADTSAPHSLLEVAKLLMACTPNGI